MTAIRLLCSEPGNSQNLFYKAGNSQNRERITKADHAYAYASLVGCTVLLKDVSALPGYRQCPKRWVVSIHNGITEPAAIDNLATVLHNSQVRIFSPTGKIEKNALYHGQKMHAKISVLHSDKYNTVVLGSSNLTGAALGQNSSNYETNCSSRVPPGDTTQLTTWFHGLWRRSLQVTPTIVDRYSKLRETFLTQNRVILPQLDAAAPVTIDQATHLWIEAGAMSGGDRNQIEFGPLLTSFFGQPFKGTRKLRITYRSVWRADRPLSHKTTQWKTDIWRLSLITSKQGGPSYPKSIIHFHKQMDAEGEFFQIRTLKPTGRTAASLMARSHRTGTVGCTGTGSPVDRQYGVH